MQFIIWVSKYGRIATLLRLPLSDFKLQASHTAMLSKEHFTCCWKHGTINELCNSESSRNITVCMERIVFHNHIFLIYGNINQRIKIVSEQIEDFNRIKVCTKLSVPIYQSAGNHYKVISLHDISVYEQQDSAIDPANTHQYTNEATFTLGGVYTYVTLGDVYF